MSVPELWNDGLTRANSHLLASTLSVICEGSVEERQKVSNRIPIMELVHDGKSQPTAVAHRVAVQRLLYIAALLLRAFERSNPRLPATERGPEARIVLGRLILAGDRPMHSVLTEVFGCHLGQQSDLDGSMVLFGECKPPHSPGLRAAAPEDSDVMHAQLGGRKRGRSGTGGDESLGLGAGSSGSLGAYAGAAAGAAGAGAGAGTGAAAGGVSATAASSGRRRWHPQDAGDAGSLGLGAGSSGSLGAYAGAAAGAAGAGAGAGGCTAPPPAEPAKSQIPPWFMPFFAVPILLWLEILPIMIVTCIMHDVDGISRRILAMITARLGKAGQKRLLLDSAQLGSIAGVPLQTLFSDRYRARMADRALQVSLLCLLVAGRMPASVANVLFSWVASLCLLRSTVPAEQGSADAISAYLRNAVQTCRSGADSEFVSLFTRGFRTASITQRADVHELIADAVDSAKKKKKVLHPLEAAAAVYAGGEAEDAGLFGRNDDDAPDDVDVRLWNALRGEWVSQTVRAPGRYTDEVIRIEAGIGNASIYHEGRRRWQQVEEAVVRRNGGYVPFPAGTSDYMTDTSADSSCTSDTEDPRPAVRRTRPPAGRGRAPIAPGRGRSAQVRGGYARVAAGPRELRARPPSESRSTSTSSATSSATASSASSSSPASSASSSASPASSASRPSSSASATTSQSSRRRPPANRTSARSGRQRRPSPPRVSASAPKHRRGRGGAPLPAAGGAAKARPPTAPDSDHKELPLNCKDPHVYMLLRDEGGAEWHLWMGAGRDASTGCLWYFAREGSDGMATERPQLRRRAGAMTDSPPMITLKSHQILEHLHWAPDMFFVIWETATHEKDLGEFARHIPGLRGPGAHRILQGSMRKSAIRALAGAVDAVMKSLSRSHTGINRDDPRPDPEFPQRPTRNKGYATKNLHRRQASTPFLVPSATTASASAASAESGAASGHAASASALTAAAPASASAAAVGVAPSGAGGSSVGAEGDCAGAEADSMARPRGFPALAVRATVVDSIRWTSGMRLHKGWIWGPDNGDLRTAYSVVTPVRGVTRGIRGNYVDAGGLIVQRLQGVLVGGLGTVLPNDTRAYGLHAMIRAGCWIWLEDPHATPEYVPLSAINRDKTWGMWPFSVPLRGVCRPERASAQEDLWIGAGPQGSRVVYEGRRGGGIHPLSSQGSPMTAREVARLARAIRKESPAERRTARGVAAPPRRPRPAPAAAAAAALGLPSATGVDSSAIPAAFKEAAASLAGAAPGSSAIASDLQRVGPVDPRADRNLLVIIPTTHRDLYTVMPALTAGINLLRVEWGPDCAGKSMWLPWLIWCKIPLEKCAPSFRAALHLDWHEPIGFVLDDGAVVYTPAHPGEGRSRAALRAELWRASA